MLCGDVSGTLFRTHDPHGAARYDSAAGTLHAWRRRHGQDVWSVVACDGPDLGTSFGAAQVADTVFVGGGNGRDSGTLWRRDCSRASSAGWQSCGQLWEDADAAAEATVRLVDGGSGGLLVCAGPACAVVEYRCGADGCAGRLLRRPRDDGGRTGFSAVSFGGGDVVAFGGRDAFGAVCRDVFRWADGRWTEEYCGGSVPEPRVDHCADTLPKGDVMVVVGGFDQAGAPLVCAHTLCLLSRTWRSLVLAPAVSALLPAASLLFTRAKPCGLLLAGVHGGVVFTPSARGRAKAKPPAVRPRPPPTTAAAAAAAPAAAADSAAAPPAARAARPVFSVRTANAETARLFSAPQLCADAAAQASDTQLSAADRERVVARLAVRREGGGYAGATEAEYRAMMPEAGEAELPPRLTREEERWQVERLFAHEAGARRLKAQLLLAKWRPSTPRSVLPQDTIDAVVRNLTPGPSCVRPRPPKVTAPLDGRARRLVRRLHTADVAQRKRRQGECVERCYYSWDAYWNGEAWQKLGEYALPTRNRGRGC